MIRLICYGLFFACWVSALVYDILYIPNFDGRIWFYKLKFLTIINMVLQSFYFGFCLLRAFVDYCAERPNHGPHRAHPTVPSYYTYTKLHALCDYLYTRLAFPAGIFVVIMFWGLYAIDRELIYPVYLDKIIPGWVNHVMHTAPGPFILVDSLLICHKYPPRWEGIRSAFGYGILYQLSIIGWYFAEGEWAYPILDYLDNFQRALFFLGATVFLLVLYLLGDFFNSIIWGVAAHPPAASTAPKPIKKTK